MNNLNKLIKQIFSDFIVDGVSIPFSYLFCEDDDDAAVDTYCVYYKYGDKFETYSNDRPNIEGISFTVDIYSKNDYTKIREEIIKRMLENNILWTGDATEDYEQDTGLFHLPMGFYFFGNVKI